MATSTTLAEYTFPLPPTRAKWSFIIGFAFSLTLVVIMLLDHKNVSPGDWFARVGLFLWSTFDATRSARAFSLRGDYFISVRVPYGTILTARLDSSGWVFWEYPNGERVFTDPMDDKLAWHLTQKRPFPGDPKGDVK